ASLSIEASGAAAFKNANLRGCGTAWLSIRAKAGYAYAGKTARRVHETDGSAMAVALGTNTVVTIFGGSGFLGRYVVQALARAGCRIKVAVRRPDLAVHLQPLGTVGQIALIQANVRDERSVQEALRGADAAVNLVGILQQSGRQKFRAIHA